MYTPVKLCQLMDVYQHPYDNKWTRAIKQTLQKNDSVMSFVWHDTEFLNPEYKGEYKYINDILLQHRSYMYRAMTGDPTIPKDPKEDRDMAAEIFSTYLMPNKWAQNKQVYKFDSELELSLADSEDIKIPVRVLDRLPYQTFYIEFAEDGIFRSNFHGAFINIVPERNGYLVYIERVREDLMVMFGTLSLVPNDEDNGTFIFLRENVTPEKVLDRNKDWPEFSFFMLNALLYLCADNAEIRESPVTKSTYHPGKTVKNKFSEVRQWDCGCRFGTEIRRRKLSDSPKQEENSQKETTNNTVIRRTPAAHTRRAHWHHYWTGPMNGERTLILHWIAPTYVSGQKSDSAVIHKVS